ncbi:antibiotic ABC transporter permease [Clostridium sulfidigenes]|uniref:Antibiotic ABC transporter permease n=1 Tax=Clostridium sulfidigenes TaxID=318464 RepID=A0A084JIY5_9CLOT|nr:MMPL family transporter [Clostridium sulfidigenes]KEZ88919.1 antibiotic ABC transporter permease [Clostridium sulfidigenes]
MAKISKKIAESRVIILVLAFLLLIPSVLGFIKTKINYDILSYLPDDLETVRAEEILKRDFDCGSLSMLIVEGMEDKDVAKIKEKVEKIQGVQKVLWINDVLDSPIPKDILPSNIQDVFYAKDSTMMVIMLEEGSANIITQNAVEDIRKVAGEQSFLSGMAGIVKDTKDLSDKETPFYVLIAVVLSLIVLALTMDSVVIPVIFLGSIGIAVIYNMGSNIIFGEISYITKALSAILQLGVTMDYSIFLLHRYDEEREVQKDKVIAMANAIANTMISVAGSSLTTIAGFLALCTMDLALGKDIGLVMAKGVLLGVICTVTVLPALILTFDRVIHKYRHKTLLPTFEKTSEFVVKHHKAFVLIGILVFIPAFIGKVNAKVYYNLDESLPKDLPSIVGTNKLKNDYGMTSTNMILIKDSLDNYKVKAMADELEQVDGVSSVIALEKILGPRVPESFIPKDLLEKIRSGGYELFVVNSEYKAATDEVKEQLVKINDIVKKYDSDGLVSGEAPLTNDLIKISDIDFKNVSIASIVAIFIIIALVFMSLSLPIILVIAIELAIFINLGIPFYTGSVIPFIASIVIGTIQLGATVDYAILLTSRFKEELEMSSNKMDAMRIAVQSSSRSIITSALTFFGATAGVGIISKLEMVSSLCTLMARGAIISMFVILFVLPGILLISEKVIIKTSKGFIKNVEEAA